MLSDPSTSTGTLPAPEKERIFSCQRRLGNKGRRNGRFEACATTQWASLVKKRVSPLSRRQITLSMK
jgi:hypothetical protein